MAATPESDSSPCAFSAHGLVPVSVTHSRSMTSRLLPAIRPAGPDGGVPKARAVFHGALGYTVELGLLPANPIGLVRWRAPRAAAAVSPATVASPAQVRAILTQVSRIKPELAAFFGCLYYARRARKKPSPCAATTSSSRPAAAGAAAARLSSPPPARALAAPGPAPASLISRPVSSTAPTAPSASSPSRPSWSACSAVTSATMAPRRTGGCSAAPAAACSASRSTAAPGTPPARQRSARTWPPPRSPAAPTTCGHAALSLWLNASGTPAEVAARAGHSARVLHDVYVHCTDGQEDTVSQRIEDALIAGTGITHSSPRAKASGYPHRRHRPRPRCPLYVRAQGHLRCRSCGQPRTGTYRGRRAAKAAGRSTLARQRRRGAGG